MDDAGPVQTIARVIRVAAFWGMNTALVREREAAWVARVAASRTDVEAITLYGFDCDEPALREALCVPDMFGRRRIVRLRHADRLPEPLSRRLTGWIHPVPPKGRQSPDPLGHDRLVAALCLTTGPGKGDAARGNARPPTLPPYLVNACRAVSADLAECPPFRPAEIRRRLTAGARMRGFTLTPDALARLVRVIAEDGVAIGPTLDVLGYAVGAHSPTHS